MVFEICFGNVLHVVKNALYVIMYLNKVFLIKIIPICTEMINHLKRIVNRSKGHSRHDYVQRSFEAYILACCLHKSYIRT